MNLTDQFNKDVALYRRAQAARGLHISVKDARRHVRKLLSLISRDDFRKGVWILQFAEIQITEIQNLKSPSDPDKES